MRGRLVRGGGSASGLLVVDGETGAPVCARAAGRQRPLASNMKLFTTSTALSRLGPESRIATRLETDGTVDSKGVLHGSLYLVGGGDPALGVPVFYNRFLGGLGTNLFLFKAQVREAGIDAVTGRLYADDSIFDRLRGVADSGYATSPEIGPLSGLDFDSGYSSASGSGFAADPALTAAATLAQSLRGAGVRVSSGAALGTAPPGSSEIARVESPPLTEIVNTTDVYSDNHFAEMLIKLLGAHFGGAGSTAAGAKVVEQFARGHGSGVHAVDGSGLTRSGRASPTQIVGLLRAMRGTPAGEELIQDMALAGHEGTVADRMHGTAAYGRCRTKTGTLTGVSNLSGYCFNRDGKVMIFSILMAGVRDLNLAHYEQDLIAGEAAGY
ncbi:MAG TPA: D-alanyl-D-alanine carboxypeptidase/D-alanyl-D-alanine-endopeptidase [Solirubrobacterales bacterium]|jgi:D-alanyl-D-alanine carboxypeptidase/D-alanyl-D-alanine-endopeptidase (penicillin-binding protein 4)|nr:D-alanyl-D-alanine carboxypeptidase/D-alanyl-D-alanine-endopeptidase [Solirubrobacterales bacterium]